MKDLGFGLVDQRTVIIVLITAGLANLFLGFPFPIDTQNILTLFIGLILLTGYLYAARTIIRFPFAIGLGIRAAIEGYGGKQTRLLSELDYLLYKWENQPGYKKIGKIIRRFTWFGLSFVDQDNWKGWLGLVDRLGIILATLFATLPIIGKLYMREIGIVGLIIMVLVFILGGSFSFIVEDALKRAEDAHKEEHERLVKAASTKPDFPRAIETYTVDHRFDNIGG